MVGIPLLIELAPEFVTGRQLYEYIARHVRKVVSSPITVCVLCSQVDSFERDFF